MPSARGTLPWSPAAEHLTDLAPSVAGALASLESALVARIDATLADAVAEAARESGVRVWEHHAAPGGPVVGLASLIALTDFAATYLALGLGIDPTVSAHVADLRDRTR